MRILILLLAAVPVLAQTTAPVIPARFDWRRIGSTVMDTSLASFATGPVERVWYDGAGARLFALTSAGKVYETDNFEHWEPVTEGVSVPRRLSVSAPHLPEAGARVLPETIGGDRMYAVGGAVYASADGGLNWRNLTDYHGLSIIGSGLTDLAVSPRSQNELVASDRFGVWRSVDGGLSWTGLNETLPNLMSRRITGVPEGVRGLRLELAGLGEFEWAPGEKQAWRPVDGRELRAEAELLRKTSVLAGRRIRAAAAEGDYLYAGGEGGRLWSSPDGGRSWRAFRFPGAGGLERIFVVPDNPRVALAVFGRAEVGAQPVHVAKTTNGGLFWDDITAGLPDVPAHGIAADLGSGAVYVATDRGAWYTIADLRGAGGRVEWKPLTEGLTNAAVRDVRLGVAGNQIYIAVDGAGVYAAMAPHRFLKPAVVNAADQRARAAAPGALLSVLGGEVRNARAGSLEAKVLAAAGGESQIQVPFGVTGSALSLALTTSGRAGAVERLEVGIPLREASPAIFVDRDGTPMVLDADSGVLLDAMRPAHAGARVQILATGLGRVEPAWPTGMPAPLNDPPRVLSPVRVLLDGTPIPATRATLAPGYVGFYLVEFVVPDIVDAGPAELYLEAGGAASNRTRIYLEP